MPHLSPMKWTMMLTTSMTLLLLMMMTIYYINKNKMLIIYILTPLKNNFWKWFQEYNKL